MKEMTYDEIKRMQADAERRVNEMDRRSRSFVESLNSSDRTAADTQNHNPRFMPVRETPAPKNIKMPVEFPERAPRRSEDSKNGREAGKPRFVYEPPSRQKNPTPSVENGTVRTNVYGRSASPALPFLNNLSREDTERLFLLSLCMLLKNENADGELITALMYIMT